MPRTHTDVEGLLDRLDELSAHDLESQTLDFKEWDLHSLNQSTRTVVSSAVCMANGGGGTVVFGVADKLVGRECAILGVPPEVSVNRLRAAVYDSTDPKLTPVFQELHVPEGTGRLILMHVHPGMPPYTDTAGRGTIRIGTDCKPLTGTLRRRLLEETEDHDFSTGTVDAPIRRLISPVAMESLRDAATAERAPRELLRLGDEDLLRAIGVIRDSVATRAMVIVAGSPHAIREHVPNYVWTHARMSSETDYSDRVDGTDAVTVALGRILDRIMADNPIETVRREPYHFEYRTYPEVALREALLNALCHGDFRVAGPRLVKQYPDRIEISNPGGLVGDLTPENILHHPPAARNRCLVDALGRLRLINRMNLGMERIYSSLLMEGKPPPEIEDMGDAVRLTFRASKLSAAFRGFVGEQARKGIALTADHMLVLRHLLRRPAIRPATAARLCQRRLGEARDALVEMEGAFGLLERGANGREEHWTLVPEVRAALTRVREPDDRMRSWREIKDEVLREMRARAVRGEEPLANAVVRRMTRLDRQQVNRLIHELVEEGGVRIDGHGRGARYVYVGSPVGGE
ncbi:MAG: putative DNA binding domain-containing protein [Gemmatimonadetes bacterium]|nr:putative DNA binding domain-containing protein [Gemmatimonadota bacterium]MCY3942454.1 putative DNA binding domain-containing protein [Gemmatimonadota bacterium]